MANPKGNPQNLKPFQAGQLSPNPGGKPVGARNRLQANFIKALGDDFEEHGAVAIAAMRERDPSSYVRVIASLMPKELEIKRPLQDLSDEEIESGMAALLALIGPSEDAPGGIH